ncbi:MAG TPA: glycosyltransferase family 4 protein [Pseudolabrys sp.]|jgi:glycosyltransferase involved in cell wall biosynthesis|nr:glycosyltransferase family 4 protein [Pseudolabrys sp.]
MKLILHEMATYTHRQELAKALASRGHEVSYLYCPSASTPSRRSLCFTPDDDVIVVPVELGAEFAKWQLVKRFLQERVYGARVSSVIASRRPDLVISGNSPIAIQAAIQKTCRGSGTPFLFWLEDVYSIGIKSVLSKVPVIGASIAAGYALLERRVAQQSNGIVAISDDFRDLAVEWGVDPARIAVVENWGVIPPDPLPPKDNDWAAQHGLADKRVLLYSGTLGFKHNPQLFLELATEFHREDDVCVVVISEGYGAEWLSLRGREFPQLVLLPYQSAENYHKALAAADVLVAILDPSAAKYSVPSKILSYMTAGRPILAAIPADNLAARTIKAACAGLIVEPQNSAELRRAARSLVEDEECRKRLGAAGLAYARANFDIYAVAARFEELFRRFIDQPSHAAGRPLSSARSRVLR